MITVFGNTKQMLVPLSIATGEKYLGVHDLTFTTPTSMVSVFEPGMSVLLTWFPNKEFIIVSVDSGVDQVSVRCMSTEYILSLRPAVPDIRSTSWKQVEYPDGWEFGDPETDVEDIPIVDVLREVWTKSTKWYQQSGFNTGAVDLVSELTGTFGSEVTGTLGHYVVEGSILESIQTLIGMSTSRLRLESIRTDRSNGYDIGFKTVRCNDRVMPIRINNYRSQVKSTTSNIDLSDKASIVLRADEDGVLQSKLYTPRRNYVTISSTEGSIDNMSDLAIQKDELNELVYSPYKDMSGGYALQFEFHGELDLSGVHPGDTVTTDSTHPRPSWVPEELMISEIIRTLDQSGYREYPVLTPVPAVRSRDNSATLTIKNSIRRFDVN